MNSNDCSDHIPVTPTFVAAGDYNIVLEVGRTLFKLAVRSAVTYSIKFLRELWRKRTAQKDIDLELGEQGSSNDPPLPTTGSTTAGIEIGMDVGAGQFEAGPEDGTGIITAGSGCEGARAGGHGAEVDVNV
ncbi:hypothetical protein TWF506_002545 [Arthrobotrys conoides]|uniref:Uncharacterized protein n=1 Tax=Arthrobotrys conoides TaxID=74498 RepID=A0AAN8RUX0_9PEZI